MEIDKALQFSRDYLSHYANILILALRSPAAAVDSVVLLAEETGRGVPTTATPRRFVTSGLLAFVLVSIFLGATINSWIPGRQGSPGFVDTAVIVVLFWLAYSALTHLICKALLGRGAFRDTLSAALIVFGAVYVLANFMAMLWGIFVTAPYIEHKLQSSGALGAWLADYPDLYFLFQFLLLAGYLPPSLRAVHKFGRVRRLAVGVLVPTVVLVLGILTTTGPQKDSDPAGRAKVAPLPPPRPTPVGPEPRPTPNRREQLRPRPW